MQVKEKTDRELALEWWNTRPRYIHEGPLSKEHYADIHYPGRFYNDLTGREIELIYKHEKPYGNQS